MASMMSNDQAASDAAENATVTVLNKNYIRSCY